MEEIKTKIPKTGNIDFLYIITNNKKTEAVTDGKGNVFKVKGKGYEVYENKNIDLSESNMYLENEYEFDRFLTGFDY